MSRIISCPQHWCILQSSTSCADEEPQVTSPPFTPLAAGNAAHKSGIPSGSLFGPVPSPKTVYAKAAKTAEFTDKTDDQPAASASGAEFGWPSDFLKVRVTYCSGPKAVMTICFCLSAQQASTVVESWVACQARCRAHWHQRC